MRPIDRLLRALKKIDDEEHAFAVEYGLPCECPKCKAGKAE